MWRFLLCFQWIMLHEPTVKNIIVITIGKLWVHEEHATENTIELHSPLMVSALVTAKLKTSKYSNIQCNTNVKGKISSVV